VLVPTTVLAAGSAAKPAIEIKTNLPGKKIIATPNKLGIYYWDNEKKVGKRSAAKAPASSNGRPSTSCTSPPHT